MIANVKGRISIPGGNYAGKGVGWMLGVNSFDHPLSVNELQLRWMENAVTQGGFAQTRPGLRTSMTFDTTIADSAAEDWWVAQQGPLVHPQMLMSFTPTNGQAQLVFAISGTLFFCLVNPDGTLGTTTEIPGVQFSKNADVLVGCRCTQSASIVAGQYVNNITPRNLLIIQDGNNRACAWDGQVATLMNPGKRIQITLTSDTLYPEDWNQTRIGLWMAWSGNRLWVSNGRNVYASDLNDPTHFTEELKLQSLPVMTFPGDVTGIVDRGTSGTNRSQVIVFTAFTTWTLWSGIQARLPDSTIGAQGWAFTSDFMAKIFDAVGCVAGKSPVLHRGLLYWMSADGAVMFDGSSTVNSTQNLPPIDQEMAYSKMRVSPPAQSQNPTCAGRYKNYLWWSVPVGPSTNGRRYNNHMQVLDRQTTVVRSTGTNGAFQAGTTGWQGVWTGIRPVEWATAMVGNKERCYAISIDLARDPSIAPTGDAHIDAVRVVRIWQAFQSNRADNGKPIPWLVETRVHPVQPSIFEYGIFRHFRLILDQIKGNLDVVGMWRGLKGTYHELLTTRITATPGSILLPIPQFTPITNDTDHQSFALQGRTVISRNRLEKPTCTAQGVESEYSDGIDHAFSLALKFTGRGALSSYLIVADSKEQNTEGTDQKPTGVDETGFNIVPDGGCPSHAAGTTPDYIALPQQPELGDCPYLPSASLTAEYVAPQP